MKKRKDILKYWGRSVFDSFIKHYSDKNTVEERQISRDRTYIHFVNEGIISIIEQGEHRVDFYTPEDDFLLSTPLPIVEDGGKAYFDICFGVENGIITLKFPVYNWVDNYPHCDGEYDRWDTTVIGYHVMKFNLSDNSATIDLFN